MGILDIHGGDIAVSGGKYAAGIGGCEDKSSGEIRIWGGNILATGGENGAGIGGGYGGSGTLTNIYGGEIIANGGESAAGIGGGRKNGAGGDSEDINIYGGVVEAYGGESTSFGSRCAGAGIGGGAEGKQIGPIRIYGGKVKAIGCNYSAGIGGGNESGGGTIQIYDGEIEAYGGQFGAGIGGGLRGNAGIILIYNGRVVAVAQHRSGYSICSGGAGIGGGSDGSGGYIHIHGGHVFAQAEDGAGIGGGRKGGSGNVMIEDGTVVAMSIVGGAGIGTGANEGQCGEIIINGGKVVAYGGDEDYKDIITPTGSEYNTQNYMLKILAQTARKAPYFQFLKDVITEAIVQILEICLPKPDDFGGAGIGGGLKCNGGTVQINGGTVLAHSGHTGSPAIGHGYLGTSNGTLTIYDKAMVIAGTEVGDAAIQLSDNRVSSCLNSNHQYARIESCGHMNSDSYTDHGDGTYTAGDCPYCAYTGTEILPHTFFREGEWYDPSCWKSGHVPDEGNSVFLNDNCIINEYEMVVSDVITCTFADTIFIFDKGELFHRNEGVPVMVEKNIMGYNDGGGWYFIASPLADAYAATEENGLSAGNYDLYYYDEATHYWINHKQGEYNTDPGFKLNNGIGYLYANAAPTTRLEFSGTLRPGEESVTFSDLSHQASSLNGFNLVGNPFVYTMYANQPYYIAFGENLRLVEDYWATGIGPCEGILVKATAENNYSVTLSKTRPQHTNNGRLQIIVAQQSAHRDASTFSDNAIVSFNQGSQLEKFSFGKYDALLYIPEGMKNCAIAYSEGNGEMPVNFKPFKSGKYTLTVDCEGVEMDYLHLIDNMTGADVDLLQTPSYTFGTSTSDYESRFRLVFAAHRGEGTTTNSEPFAYYANGAIHLIESQCIAAHSCLQIIDTSGRIVMQEDVVNSVPTNGLSAGLYLLRLVGGKEVRTQKVVIN